MPAFQVNLLPVHQKTENTSSLNIFSLKSWKARDLWDLNEVSVIDCQLDRPKKINQMNSRTPEIRDGHLTDNTLHLEGISAKSIFTYWDATHSEQKRR